MRQQDNAQNEINALQNHFTGYLMVALRRRKRDYMRKRNRLEALELPTDFQSNPRPDEAGCNLGNEVLSFSQIEDGDLLRAISHLSERERYILLQRVLNECEYAELAERLNLRRSCVSTAYHRIIKKLKKELQGG